MSKSHRELIHKKTHSNTMYLHGHNRTRSKKFVKEIAIEPLLNKGKHHYHSNQLPQALACFEEIIHNTDTLVVQAWYLAALILIAQEKHSKSLKYLMEVSNKCGNYKENTYLFAAICLNAMGKYSEALNFMNKLCDSDKKSVDEHFFRGKLYFKLEKYEEAVENFKKALSLGCRSEKVRIFYCEALQRCQRNQQVSIQLEQIIEQIEKKSDSDPNKKKMLKKCYLISICMLISEQNFNIAEQLCQKSMDLSPDSETLFHKAKIHQIYNKKDQMLLCLNESLNISSNTNFTIGALQQLIVAAMEERDFYQAFQYTKRMSFLKIESKKLLELARLAEGVTFLMKKKFGQALLLFGAIKSQSLSENTLKLSYHPQSLQKLSQQKQQNLLNLYHSSMGYAYFCLGEITNALKKYKSVDKNEKKEEHLLYFYNIALCEGIQLFEGGKVEESIKQFELAAQYLMRPQPYFYIAVVLVNKHLSDQADTDFFMKIIEIIDTGIKIGENSQMYYYRAMLYLYLGMNSEAIDDIDKAIQKSEDNVSSYFFLRGLIFFQQKNYEQAIAQFSTSISIDEGNYDAYLQRAKAKLLSEQSEGAYLDLQSHPMHDDWKPLFQLHQGNYEEIVIERTAEERILENAQFMLGKFSDAGPAGKLVLALICQNYKEVENILDDALSIGFHVGCLQLDDLYTLKAYCCFKLEKFEDALQNLFKTEELLRKSSTISYYQEEQKKLLAIKVNIILMTLINKQIDKSLELCNTLINDVYEGFIYDELVKLKNMITAIQENPDIVIGDGNDSDSDEENQIALFRTDQMISGYLPPENYKGIKFKFLITFPKTKVLDIQIAPYQAPLINFSLKNIESKPQAPWMRRDENGVIFTNQIHNFDDLNLQTEQNEVGEVAQKIKIKEQLQLDPQVLKRLQKLNRKKSE